MKTVGLLFKFLIAFEANQGVTLRLLLLGFASAECMLLSTCGMNSVPANGALD